jgi:hypothetical protein
MFDLLLRAFATSTAAVPCPGDSSTSCDTGLPVVTGGSGEIHTILQITFGVAAALSVTFVVVGGLRFVLSSGNSENVTKARETIIYSLVGLIVSLIAEGIVTFVIRNI